MASDGFPKRFGKYLLLDHLATGGMAEVYIAKVGGVENFERLLAIKCMRPEIARDAEFARMFIDEANVAGQLHHTNIAQIFELGRHQEQLYIAMELVEGRDLRNLLVRAQERGTPLPLPFAAYVISRAASGLDYAHRKTGSNGQPLNLVHRDISPPNLIVSFEGEVKVVDFGIAKASMRGGDTRVGVLKGKFSYMSPEQVVAGEVDRRADIFTLGTVLYEIVTGHKLFTGDGEFEILEKVKSASIPDLRATLPDAPPELISVLLHALTRKPSERFAFASEMSKALEPLLIQDRTIFGAREAAAVLQGLYAEEITRARLATAQLAALTANDALDPIGSEDWTAKTETFHSSFQVVPSDALQAVRGALDPSDAGEDANPVKPVSQDDPAFWKAPTVQIRVRDTDRVPKSGASAAAPERFVRRPLVPPWAWAVGAAVALGLSALGVLGLRSQGNPPAALDADAQESDDEASEDTPVDDAEAASAAQDGADARAAGSASASGAFGFISVRVKGARTATVYVDGKAAGRAPLNAYRVPVGTRTIKVVEIKKRARKKVRSAKVEVDKKNTRRSPALVVLQL